MIKKYIGDNKIPRMALRTIWGFDDEEGIHIEIEASEEVHIVETLLMNPMELACVRGWTEVLKYFVEELNLVAK